MLKFAIKWALARIKVNIRSISFWLMTILMMLALILTRRVIGEYSADTHVLLYADHSIGEWCCAYMSEHMPDGFIYERVDSENELIDRVSTGEVSCGVVFEDGTEVTIYQTAGSVDGYVVRELVYPVMAEYLSTEALSEYVRGLYPALSEEVLSGQADEAAAYVTARYREHMDELDLEIFEVKDINSGRDVSLDPETGRDVILRSDPESDEPGHAARTDENARRLERMIFTLMIVLLCGMCIYDTVHTDRSFYRAFSAGKRVILAGSQIIITIVMATTFACGMSIVFQRII